MVFKLEEPRVTSDNDYLGYDFEHERRTLKMGVEHQVFRILTITTRIVYKKGLKQSITSIQSFFIYNPCSYCFGVTKKLDDRILERCTK